MIDPLRRQRLLMFLTWALALGAGVYALYVEPFAASAERWSRQRSAKAEKLTKAKRLIAEEAALREADRALRPNDENGWKSGDALEVIEHVAKETSVTVEVLRPILSEDTPEDLFQGVEAALRAEPSSLARFLYRIEKMPPFYQVEQVHVEGSDSSGELRCSLVLNTSNFDSN